MYSILSRLLVVNKKGIKKKMSLAHLFLTHQEVLDLENHLYQRRSVARDYLSAEQLEKLERHAKRWRRMRWRQNLLRGLISAGNWLSLISVCILLLMVCFVCMGLVPVVYIFVNIALVPAFFFLPFLIERRYLISSYFRTARIEEEMECTLQQVSLERQLAYVFDYDIADTVPWLVDRIHKRHNHRCAKLVDCP